MLSRLQGFVFGLQTRLINEHRAVRHHLLILLKLPIHYHTIIPTDTHWSFVDAHYHRKKWKNERRLSKQYRSFILVPHTSLYAPTNPVSRMVGSAIISFRDENGICLWILIRQHRLLLDLRWEGIIRSELTSYLPNPFWLHWLLH